MADAYPWDRQPTETDKQYNAFAIYRDIGYGRSVAKTAEKLGLGSTTHLELWSTQNAWVARARQYDAWLEQSRRRENESSHFAELEAHRKRSREFGAAATDTATLMLELANFNLQIDRAKMQKTKRAGIVDFEKAEKIQLDKSLAPWIRAAGLVAESGQAAEAQALGVERLLDMFSEEQGDE